MQKNFIYRIKFLGPLLALFVVLAPLTLQAQELEILGKVVDQTTKAGIGGATVIVFPSGERTLTQPNGNFFLSALQAEGMFVQILKEGYQPKTIRSNLTEIFAELLLSTQVEGQRVVVRGKRDEKKVVVSRQSLSRKELKQTTSSIFDDSVKVVQTLPGVVSRGFSSQMFIRGGDSYEFSSFYDRVYLTDPYVLGGALTVFNPDVVNNIDFYSGAFPAEYNNGMSGVLDVRMRDGNPKKWQGFMELSLTDLEFLVEGPLSNDPESTTQDTFLMSFRRTYYDLAAKLFLDRSGVQLPYFYDTHIRFKFQLDESTIVRVFTLGVYEGLDIEFEDFDGDESANFKKGSEASYENIRLLQGISLTKAFSDDVVWETTLGYLYRKGDLNFYTDANRYLKIKPQENYVQLRSDLTLKPGGGHIFKTGVGFYSVSSDLDLDILQAGFTDAYDPTLTYNYIPRFEFEQNYSGRLAFVQTFYLQDDWEALQDTFFINLGLNVQYLNLTDGIIADPRGGIKLALDGSYALKLAGGMYSQFPFTKEFGRVVDDKYGNTDIKPERSYHGVLSLEKDWADYFSRLDFFGKYYDDLVTEDYEKNYVNGEIGYSYGLDFFLQKKLGDKLDGWISYTFVITRRKVVNRIDKDVYNAANPTEPQEGEYELPYNKWYAPEYDRRHTLNIVLNYSFTDKWKLSSTFKFGTGLPYTPVIDKLTFGIDTSSPLDGLPDEYDYVPVYGGYNSKRLPYYMNLDIKLSMPFFWDNWSAFIQVINAFARTNVENYSYDETYTKRREVTGLPIVPIFGIRAEF